MTSFTLLFDPLVLQKIKNDECNFKFFFIKSLDYCVYIYIVQQLLYDYRVLYDYDSVTQKCAHTYTLTLIHVQPRTHTYVLHTHTICCNHVWWSGLMFLSVQWYNQRSSISVVCVVCLCVHMNVCACAWVCVPVLFSALSLTKTWWHDWWMSPQQSGDNRVCWSALRSKGYKWHFN